MGMQPRFKGQNMPVTLKNDTSLQSPSPVDGSVCGEQLPDDQVNPTAQAERRPFLQPRNHRLLLTMKGLIALYGENGPDYGVTEERRGQDVDTWVRKNGEPKGVSKATIRRAVRELRASASTIKRS
jgi:hypothetical protein